MVVDPVTDWQAVGNTLKSGKRIYLWQVQTLERLTYQLAYFGQVPKIKVSQLLTSLF
jgi:hypothetical protein